MARYKTGVERQAESRKRRAMAIVAFIVLLSVAGGGWFIKVRQERLAVDDHLCPPEPVSYLSVLVDVTDPMTVPQRQDLRNKLEELEGQIPRYGKVTIFKVDASTDRLLTPILDLCNPGDASDVSDLNADRKATQKRWEEQYKKPVERAFETLMVASGSEASPILQSIQSVSLTELREPKAKKRPRRLVVISDLLQNTSGLSFYGRLPSAPEVLQSSDFATSRTDLSGIDVELWMLQRPDFSTTQPRALPDLWDALIAAQKGNVTSVYRVSG